MDFLDTSLLRRLFAIFYLLLLLGTVPSALAEGGAGVLKEYVERPDESYQWVERQNTRLGPCEVYELTLTSQTWRDLVWQHRMFVVVPDEMKAETEALLVIEGGSWKDKHAEPVSGDESIDIPGEAVLLATFAQQLGAPIAILLNVPRQPIFDGKKEDDIIAMTFDEYLKSGDTDWPLLLPMTKSAVRAMDAVQEFTADRLDTSVTGFTVAGASKRGWTTWLTAAADERVRGLAPMVIDMLNLEKQFAHQKEAYGEYSERIAEYVELDLPQRMSGEPGEELRQIVDPYSYRHEITQPKMLFLGTNDAFWTVDSLNLYWDHLKGEKYVVYVPNAGHDLSMDWKRVLGGLTALHRHAHGMGQRLPEIAWEYETDESKQTNSLSLRAGRDATHALLWVAESDTKDFREASWTSRPVPLDSNSQAVVKVDRPAEGYRAMFVEVVYRRGIMPLHLSTTIRVLPARD